MTTPRPGEIAQRLGPYLAPGRLERMREVLTRRTRRLTAVLDRFYDPNNVAACMRTADALGVQDVWVVRSDRTSPLGLREPSRAVSLDAARWLTRIDCEPDDVVPRLGDHRLVVTALDGTDTLDAIPLDRPLAVVFGAERDGAADALIAAAEHRVALPMRGFSQSLNVSVAFGIVMSRLRERLERERDDWVLGPDARAALLDGWVHRDVAHADAILAELGRRVAG